MNRKQFAKFLRELKKENDCGRDVDTFIKHYENENVYIYNDECIKKIFATQENLPLTTDLVNACLERGGVECVENLKLQNPYIPGEFGYKSSEPDIVLRNECDKETDRISVEFQHEGGTLYKKRLVLYVSRHFSNMVKKGALPLLDNLHVISFQLFDSYTWEEQDDFHHTIRLKNQNGITYFESLTITLVEVRKFLKYETHFVHDNSRLALWLRAIEILNNDGDFSPFEKDPIFRLLQKEAKMSNFSSGFLVREAQKMTDLAIMEYNATQRAEKKAEARMRKMAKDFKEEGTSLDVIARCTGLSVEEIKAL